MLVLWVKIPCRCHCLSLVRHAETWCLLLFFPTWNDSSAKAARGKSLDRHNHDTIRQRFQKIEQPWAASVTMSSGQARKMSILRFYVLLTCFLHVSLFVRQCFDMATDSESEDSSDEETGCISAFRPWWRGKHGEHWWQSCKALHIKPKDLADVQSSDPSQLESRWKRMKGVPDQADKGPSLRIQLEIWNIALFCYTDCFARVCPGPALCDLGEKRRFIPTISNRVD